MISPELLRRYPYFANAQDETLRELAMISEEQSVAAGSVMYHEGDRTETLYILADGEIDIQYTLGSGELRTVDTLVPGELIMWSSLVEPFRSTAVVTARQDSQLIAIDAQRLRDACREDHQLAYHLLMSLTQLLATRLEGARVQLATID